MIHEEFVFSFGNNKLYSIRDLDYIEDIFIEENRSFWSNVSRGYAMVFLQKDRKYSKDPEPVLIGRFPILDVIRKFG